MSDKKQAATITPISPNTAVHRDGEHECIVGYGHVRQSPDEVAFHSLPEEQSR